MNRKITVEIDIIEDAVKGFDGVFITTQTFHDTTTNEELGFLMTNVMTGDNLFLRKEDDLKGISWHIPKEQNAKIFAAILLQDFLTKDDLTQQDLVIDDLNDLPF